MKILAVWVVLGCGLATAQGDGSAIVHVLAGPVELKQLPKLTPQLDALPMIEPGSGVTPEVAGKINAALRRLDGSVKAAAANCGDSSKWLRTVSVTMRGPRYLSVYALDESSCKDSSREDFLPLVYDLSTGSPVNWLKLLPPGASSGVDNAADGSRVGAVIWPVLRTALARKFGEKDQKGCADLYAPDAAVPFVLWLDAPSGAILARPSDLPRIESLCDLPVMIRLETARKMGGFNPELLEALEAAHRLQGSKEPI